MPKITATFWDVGGVLLSNAWDRAQRQRALESFGLDEAEFNDRHHDRGVLSMARSQDPNSAGSQFFICHGNPRFLDKQYTAFGKLIKGDDVLEKIGTTATKPGDRPVKRMGLESVKIVPKDSVK